MRGPLHGSIPRSSSGAGGLPPATAWGLVGAIDQDHKLRVLRSVSVSNRQGQRYTATAQAPKRGEQEPSSMSALSPVFRRPHRLLWVVHDRSGSECGGPLRSRKQSSPLEWLLRDADLTVEFVRWPVPAGHQPAFANGLFGAFHGLGCTWPVTPRPWSPRLGRNARRACATPRKRCACHVSAWSCGHWP